LPLELGRLGLAHIENTSGLKPALINIEGGWQIGYLLEQFDKEWVVVFLPQAPSPMSGNVMYMPADRVRPLDITMVQAMSIVKAIGAGSSAALRGVDLGCLVLIIEPGITWSCLIQLPRRALSWRRISGRPVDFRELIHFLFR
jgi:hypothetical protein